jgi:16S rRNA (cytosine967-C5)-methyltransferase
VLVYSVCTLTRAETEDISSWLASDLISGWEVLGPPGPPWEPYGQGALLLPQSAGTDGMYLSAYRRLAV